MKTISSSIIYRGLYKDLEAGFGYDEAHRIWALAERVNRRLYEKYSAEDKYGTAELGASGTFSTAAPSRLPRATIAATTGSGGIR